MLSYFSISTVFLALRALAAPAEIQHSGSQYAGFKVVRIPTSSQESTEALKSIVESNFEKGVDVWTEAFIPNSHIDVQIPPDTYESFINEIQKELKKDDLLNRVGITIMHDDLAESIKEETKGLRTINAERVGLANPEWWNDYHSYDDHLAFLDDLVATYPNNSQIVTSGTTIEGRTITGVHVYGSSGGGKKPAIVWHGNVHAREWISGVTVEYLAYQLLSNYANTTKVASYVDNYDFYIFPIVNPDGFVFTQTTTRLWRKNRQSPPSGSTCYGRDINRNWDIAWTQTSGASTNPCSETYKGLSAADSPETKSLQTFLDQVAKNQTGLFYVDWHSYSQLFMSPYGYSCSKLPTNSAKHNTLTKAFGTAVPAVYGTQFTTGPICSTIYATSGDSTDYAYEVSKFTYSFAAELRDTGRYGFILPASQIRESGIEIWAGVQALLDNI